MKYLKSFKLFENNNISKEEEYKNRYKKIINEYDSEKEKINRDLIEKIKITLNDKGVKFYALPNQYDYISYEQGDEYGEYFSIYSLPVNYIYNNLEDNELKCSVDESNIGGDDDQEYTVFYIESRELNSIYYTLLNHSVENSFSECIQYDYVDVFADNFKNVEIDLEDVKIGSSIGDSYEKIKFEDDIFEVVKKYNCKKIKEFLKEYEFQKYIFINYKNMYEQLIEFAGENQKFAEELSNKYGK